MVRRLVWILAALTSLAACAETVTVKMAENEGWWGGANFFSREMPFSVRTSLKIDLRKDNYHNQGASLLLSNHGRVIRGNGQSTIAIRNGEIVFETPRSRLPYFVKVGELFFEMETSDE